MPGRISVPTEASTGQYTLAGLQRLGEMLGGDYATAESLGSLTISAGNVQCTGTLAEALGRHANNPDAVDMIGMGVHNATEQARASGADIAATVETALGMFLVRDEKHQPVRANLAEELKKN
jgi:hypothetical protein